MASTLLILCSSQSFPLSINICWYIVFRNDSIILSRWTERHTFNQESQQVYAQHERWVGFSPGSCYEKVTRFWTEALYPNRLPMTCTHIPLLYSLSCEICKFLRAQTLDEPTYHFGKLLSSNWYSSLNSSYSCVQTNAVNSSHDPGL